MRRYENKPSVWVLYVILFRYMKKKWLSIISKVISLCYTQPSPILHFLHMTIYLNCSYTFSSHSHFLVYSNWPLLNSACISEGQITIKGMYIYKFHMLEYNLLWLPLSNYAFLICLLNYQKGRLTTFYLISFNNVQKSYKTKNYEVLRSLPII